MHFPAGLPAARIGRRLAAVNLSDLAAAGAAPRYCLATVAAPPSFDHRRFFTGLLDACEAHGLTLAGGDLASSSEVHASLTVLGRRRARARLLRRDSARAGDALWLGGPVGESALGRTLLERGAVATAKTFRLPKSLEIPRVLQDAARAALARHAEPQPQLALGAWLASRSSRQRIAAIDVSDGVLLDLERLARASRVRCELDAGSLPTSPRFDELCALAGANAPELALTGGEDYVLLFSLPDGVRPPAKFDATRVGTVTAGVERPQDATVQVSGAELPPGRPLGWDHLAGKS